MCNLDISTIKRYENNNRETRVSSLLIYNKIFTALGIDPNGMYNDYLTFIDGDYSAHIKKMRTNLGCTQKELGKMLGVHRKTIMRWEKRINKIDYDHYVLFSSLLDNNK